MLRYKIYATRTKNKGERVLVSERAEAPSYLDLVTLRTLLTNRSEEYDHTTDVTVQLPEEVDLTNTGRSS